MFRDYDTLAENWCWATLVLRNRDQRMSENAVWANDLHVDLYIEKTDDLSQMVLLPTFSSPECLSSILITCVQVHSRCCEVCALPVNDQQHLQPAHVWEMPLLTPPLTQPYSTKGRSSRRTTIRYNRHSVAGVCWWWWSAGPTIFRA